MYSALSARRRSMLRPDGVFLAEASRLSSSRRAARGPRASPPAEIQRA